MAGNKQGYTYGATAAADHSAKVGYGVVISAAGLNGVPKVAIAGAGVRIDGVIVNGEVSGAMDTVTSQGIVYMVVGADIAAAGEVEIDANGAIITKAAGTAIGKVFAAATSGSKVPVFLY